MTFNHLHFLKHAFFQSKKYNFILLLNELFTENNLVGSYEIIFLLMDQQESYN